LQALVELAQAPDGLRDGFEVREHPAQPAVIDVVLAAALGRLRDGLLRLTLRPDEQHAAAAGDHIAHGLERTVQQENGLLEIDDMDPVADAEEIARHLRVPAPRVMAEMDAGLEQLAHSERWHRHEERSFIRLS